MPCRYDSTPEPNRIAIAYSIRPLLQGEVLGVEVMDADVSVLSSRRETPPVAAFTATSQLRGSAYVFVHGTWGFVHGKWGFQGMRHEVSVSVQWRKMLRNSRVAHDGIDWSEMPLDAANLVLENFVVEHALKLSGPSRCCRDLVRRLSTPKNNLWEQRAQSMIGNMLRADKLAAISKQVDKRRN